MAEIEGISWDKSFHGWWCDTCVTVMDGEDEESQEHEVSEATGDVRDGDGDEIG